MMQIPANWTFENRSVASHFDSHVREQLPWYDLVTGAVAHLVRHYLPQNGLMYDIGCSTGNVGRSVSDLLAARGARLVGIESSSEMCAKYAGPGTCIQADAVRHPYEPFDVAVCYLVLMFLPFHLRGALLSSLLSKVNAGGAVIVVDKISAPSGYIGTAMRRLTLAGKVAAGATADDVIAKELSLSGIQRPIDPNLIHEVAPQAFQFFAFGEFAGWLIEAPPSRPKRFGEVNI